MSMGPAELPEEIAHVLRELNPWWVSGGPRRHPPSYRRPQTRALIERLSRRKGLIEIIRGPRQVGKTTAMEQAIEHLLASKLKPTNILLVRFDQEILRSHAGGLLSIIRWFEHSVRAKAFGEGRPPYLFLDEIHKLQDWHSDVKHLGDTFPVRLILTGSSSVLVARGGRESLAGRTITTEFPTFAFREVLEAWVPKAASWLPEPVSFESGIGTDPREIFQKLSALHPQRRLSLHRHLDRYYNRGGYPRLYNGDVDDDSWADYLSETIFDRVLGVDVPDLFPVRNPQLLRWLYIEVARRTGQEVPQKKLAEWANDAGFSTNQPVIGSYVHYLDDALLIRELRRYPLARRQSARTPAKICLTDLGPRNARRLSRGPLAVGITGGHRRSFGRDSGSVRHARRQHPTALLPRLRATERPTHTSSGSRLRLRAHQRRDSAD